MDADLIDEASAQQLSADAGAEDVDVLITSDGLGDCHGVLRAVDERVHTAGGHVSGFAMRYHDRRGAAFRAGAVGAPPRDGQVIGAPSGDAGADRVLAIARTRSAPASPDGAPMTCPSRGGAPTAPALKAAPRRSWYRIANPETCPPAVCTRSSTARRTPWQSPRPSLVIRTSTSSAPASADNCCALASSMRSASILSQYCSVQARVSSTTRAGPSGSSRRALLRNRRRLTCATASSKPPSQGFAGWAGTRTISAETPEIAFQIARAVAAQCAIERIMRIAKHLRASVTSPREMRIRIWYGDIDPAVSEMGTVQLVWKIRLNKHTTVAITKTGGTHSTLCVTTDLVNRQTKGLRQEGERGLDIAVGEGRVDVHGGVPAYDDGRVSTRPLRRGRDVPRPGARSAA